MHMAEETGNTGELIVVLVGEAEIFFVQVEIPEVEVGFEMPQVVREGYSEAAECFGALHWTPYGEHRCLSVRRDVLGYAGSAVGSEPVL